MSYAHVAPTDPDEPIGVSLARLRRASRLSGVEAGRRAGMSQAKVSRIETGTLQPSVEDVGKLARALGADEDLVRQLQIRAETAQRRPLDWKPAPVGLARTQRVIAEHEGTVNAIFAFEPAIIQGLLQTGEYARSLLSLFQMQESVVPSQRRRPVASVAEAVAVRIERQEILTDPERSFHFVMMEAVLLNNFCSPEDMLGQLRRLLEVSEQYDNVSIKIVRKGAEPAMPALHGFELFDDKQISVETFNTTLTSTNEPEVQLYRRVFDSFEEKATADIESLIAEYRERYARRLSSPG